MEELAVIVFVVMLLPAKVDAVNDNAVNTGTIKLPVTVKSMVVMEDPCILDAVIDDAVTEDRYGLSVGASNPFDEVIMT